MIDTIFFLLVFFMMSTLSMVRLKVLNLDIPRQAVQGEARPVGRVEVAINDDDRITLNAATVTVKDLPEQFAAAIKSQPKAAVVLKVSAGQKTQALVSTMDLLNEVMAEQGNKNPILLSTAKASL